MNVSERTVIVRELPGRCDSGTRQKFLQNLKAAMASKVRSAIVLDCSSASRIDKQAVHLLLSCLEEAMKRNGDVRLAGLHRDAWPILEITGAGRLFRCFDTAEEAAVSYRMPAYVRESQENERSANAA